MKRTYVDAGVLIAAARGQNDVADRAMAVLDDPDRSFASSIFVKLEVLPKPMCYQQTAEVTFYETFFDAVTDWAAIDEQLLTDAFQQACQFGLAAVDALHVAAAISIGVEELVTTEKLSKPMHRVAAIKVISIAS
jgi:predicted nucleic acid-binding protein